MRSSVLSIFALSCMLVNAAPTFIEPVLINKKDVIGNNPKHYQALAQRSAHRAIHKKRQDGSLILGGPDAGVSIATLTPTASATDGGASTAQLLASVPPTTTTPVSYLAEPTRKLLKNPKMTMQLDDQPSSASTPATSSLANSSQSSAAPTSSNITSSSVAPSSSSSSEAPAASSQSASHGTVHGSYYPDWNADILPPAAIDYTKFNLIYFAFALPDQNFNLYFTQDNSVQLLQDVVQRGHAAGVQVVVSVGGWTGSKYFSPAAATSSSRTTFANNIAQMVSQYNLDGIDLDWEYPGGPGNPGNIYNDNDSANLLLLLQQIRSLIGPNKLITMATTQSTFKGPGGVPMTDVSAHAAILDHILIMNYDVWGASSNPGPNAPLQNACGNSLQPTANAQAGIDQWSQAGMPLSKIVLGLPAYGYVSQSSATSLVNKRMRRAIRGSADPQEEDLTVMKRQAIKRSEWMIAGVRERKKRDQSLPTPGVRTVVDPNTGASITICPDNHGGLGCNNTPLPSAASGAGTTLPSGITAPSIKASGAGDLSNYIGQQIGFNTLVSQGALSRSSSGTYKAINGYVRNWDTCSSTPWLRNAVRGVIVTYDDPQSIGLKAQYAASRGIGGVAFWDMSTDDQLSLQEAAIAAFP